jgi:hypothetical protein
MHRNASKHGVHLDAVKVRFQYGTRSNAAVSRMHLDAFTNGVKHPMHLDASAKRVQMRLAGAFGRIRCFILDASRCILHSVSNAFKTRMRTRFGV